MSLLQRSKAAKKRRRRVARGIGSGLGKTGGRGMNGQRSRSGVSIPAWFEGGQNPLYRRIPKRGFTNIFASKWDIVNLGALDESLGSARHAEINSAAELRAEQLAKLGLLRFKQAPIKILSHVKGDLKNLNGKKLVVNAVSEAAKKLLESVGATVELEKFLVKRKRAQRKGDSGEPPSAMLPSTSSGGARAGSAKDGGRAKGTK